MAAISATTIHTVNDARDRPLDVDCVGLCMERLQPHAGEWRADFGFAAGFRSLANFDL